MRIEVRQVVIAKFVAAGALWVAGCSGKVVAMDDGAGAGGSGSPSTIDDGPVAPGGSERPGELQDFFAPPNTRPRPLARLTREQLRDIAQDLFNVSLTSQDLATLPKARAVDTTVDPSQYVEGVWNYAGLVAKGAFTNPGNLAGFCEKKGVTEAACAEALVTQVAPLLLQRDPTAAETKAYVAHYVNAAGLPADERLQVVLRALLMSPGFLFPTETAPSAPVADHFRLSRLTLALWNSLPDARSVSNFAADAKSGKATVIDALLKDPRAQRLYERIANHLADLSSLGDLGKAPALAPAFTKQIQLALRQELAASLAKAVQGGDTDSFSELLTTNKVWVNKLTAPLYGLSSNSDSLEWVATPDEQQRSGLLSAAPLLSVLAGSDEGSVVKRGVFVLERLLCVAPPPPPANVPPLDAAAVPANATQRERLMAHRQPSCVGCHDAIDSVGFGLERYDAIGRFVTTDHGQPITGLGTFPQTLDGPEKKFEGAKQLGKLLAASTQARECFVSQLHAALTDRDSYDDERAVLDDARKRFTATGDVHQLVTTLLTNAPTSARF